MESTITAISTPIGTGGISIIRISGKKAFEIAKKIFRGSKCFEDILSHTINYGRVVDFRTECVLDEVLLSKMEAPHTFTKEDIVEVNCHGGMLTVKKILELILSCGARLAEPGEFTKRAFLNGRIDLSQAEAVIDIINSKSENSRKIAMDQLEGKLSKAIGDIKHILVSLLAHIEVNIDYPEYDIENLTRKDIEVSLCEANGKMQKLLGSFEKGKILREGLSVVIAGRPNVGKSSLLNEFANQKRAIVTDIPGTTRDIIEEFINIKGVPIKIVDTAGIRVTEDLVEKIGIQSAKNAVKKADLLLYMIDTTQDVKEDLEILDKLEFNNVVVVVNKIDLNDVDDKIFSMHDQVKISIKNGVGLEHLEDLIAEKFYCGDIEFSNEMLLTNVRHKNLIQESLKILEETLNESQNSVPVDLLSVNIKFAADCLGQITGECIQEEMINEIFKNFCIGK